VLIEAERKKKALPVNTDNNQNITFKSFLRILEDNFKRDVSVDFYAEKLNMSARNLNLICRTILQRSVSEIIETRKLTEAKNLLMHSNKTISEIGFDLGYNEKAYFTKVFKKKAGVTPSEFRNEMKKML
jgi:AraC-like DNA-binding protein